MKTMENQRRTDETEWSKFKRMTDDLFEVGFKLSKRLQVEAVNHLHDNVLKWSNILNKMQKVEPDITCRSSDNHTDIVTDRSGHVGDEEDTPQPIIVVPTETDTENAGEVGTRSSSSSSSMSIADMLQSNNSKQTQDLLHQVVDQITTIQSEGTKLKELELPDITVFTKPMNHQVQIDEGCDSQDAEHHSQHLNINELMKAVKCEMEELKQTEESEPRVSPSKEDEKRATDTESEPVEVILHVRPRRHKSRRSYRDPDDDFPRIILDSQDAVKDDNPDADQVKTSPLKKSEEADQSLQTPKKKSRGRPRKNFANISEFAVTATEKCPKCVRKFGTKQILDMHLKVHEGKMPLLCDICNKSYTSRGGFENHIWTHDPDHQSKCQYCDYRCANYTMMSKHITMRHRCVSEWPYLCDLCGKGFLQISALKTHMVTHQSENKQFACDVCPFRTHTKNILSIHKKNMHTDKEFYQCDLCSVKVKYKASLVEHRMRHFGEKPNECSECKKRFVTKSQLAQHRRTHAEVKKWRCPVCDKRFLTKHKLARHQTIHTGDRNHECGFCDYKCNVRGNLRKHWQFVHKITDFDRRMKRVQVLNADSKSDVKDLVSEAQKNEPEPAETNMAEDKELHAVIEIVDKETSFEAVYENITSDSNTDTEPYSAVETSSTTVVHTPAVTQAFNQLPPMVSATSFTAVPSATSFTAVPSINELQNRPVTTPLQVEPPHTPTTKDLKNVTTVDGVSVHTKVEVSDDGTEYVYLYFPDQPHVTVAPSHVAMAPSPVPDAHTEEYVVTMEDTSHEQPQEIHTIL